MKYTVASTLLAAMMASARAPTSASAGSHRDSPYHMFHRLRRETSKTSNAETIGDVNSVKPDDSGESLEALPGAKPSLHVFSSVSLRSPKAGKTPKSTKVAEHLLSLSLSHSFSESISYSMPYSDGVTFDGSKSRKKSERSRPSSKSSKSKSGKTSSPSSQPSTQPSISTQPSHKPSSEPSSYPSSQSSNEKAYRIFSTDPVISIASSTPTDPVINIASGTPTDPYINIATDKNFSSTSSQLRPSANAFDGNPNTRWESVPNRDEEWLQVDLGAVYQLSRVVIAWEYASAKSYDIQVSNDNSKFTTVWSKTDGFAGMGTVESLLGGATGRYVRMQGHARATEWGYSIWEMFVFGDPINVPLPLTPINVANGKKASSSSQIQPVRYAFDGNPNTRWESARGDEVWMQVDLGAVYQISRVVIDWENASAKSYDIQVSNDNSKFTTAWSKTDGFAGMSTVESLLGGATGRYVRMQGHARATEWGYSIWEMEVFGTIVAGAVP